MEEEWEENKRKELTDIFAGLATVGLVMAGVARDQIPKRAYSIADALVEERAIRQKQKAQAEHKD